MEMIERTREYLSYWCFIITTFVSLATSQSVPRRLSVDFLSLMYFAAALYVYCKQYTPTLEPHSKSYYHLFISIKTISIPEGFCAAHILLCVFCIFLQTVPLEMCCSRENKSNLQRNFEINLKIL